MMRPCDFSRTWCHEALICGRQPKADADDLWMRASVRLGLDRQHAAWTFASLVGSRADSAPRSSGQLELIGELAEIGHAERIAGQRDCAHGCARRIAWFPAARGCRLVALTGALARQYELGGVTRASAPTDWQ